MNKILSQDEVDALLKGVQSGEVDLETEKKKFLGVRPYDLTNQEQMIRGRMQGLELANERFTELFKNSVSNFIMRFIDISIHNVEIIKFGEFIKTIPFPSSINTFKMEPLKGYAIFVIEAPLLFAFVEFFFGGNSTKDVRSEVKAFTPIEQRVNKKVVTTALNDMASAWTGIAPIRPEHVNSEINPQFVTIIEPSEIVIKIEVHLEVEDFKGRIFFCIPYSMVEPVKEKLYSGFQRDKFEIDQRCGVRLKEIIMDSSVGIAAEIGRVGLTFGELMKLEVGGVINLGKSTSDELTINVQGIPKFSGVPGYSRGNQAIKITKIINKGESYDTRSNKA
jgi:flagellar motor switch protein FliM